MLACFVLDTRFDRVSHYPLILKVIHNRTWYSDARIGEFVYIAFGSSVILNSSE